VLEEALKLPFEMQLVLAAGYLAYRTANAGLDRSHKNTDIVFQVFAFGTIAYGLYKPVEACAPIPVAMLASVLGALIAAIIWRSIGRATIVKILRALGVTRENFSPSVWDSILHAREKWAYVSVIRTDDVTFESNLEALPVGLPLEPMELDMDGNVAIYITRTIDPKGEINELGTEGVLDTFGRAHLTYIPVDQIKNITISFATDITSSADFLAREEAPQDG